MKTKTITKTFYVSYLGNLNEEIHNAFNLVLKNEKTELFNKQVQISWSEPEKKIEITESDIVKIYEKVMKEDCQYIGFNGLRLERLIKELFGASDE